MIRQKSGFTLALSAAMLLGIRNNLSDEIYTAYTDTGAVHVLAVSGLHVGIVNSFLVLLLFWWRPKSKWQKALKAVIIIAGNGPRVLWC